MKKFLMLPCIAAVAIATFVAAKNLGSNAYKCNDLFMANVEALSRDESHKYAIRDEKSVEIVDDNTGVAKKIVVIVCEGTGELICP